jgi:acyl-coenzyme A thioesterase 9
MRSPILWSEALLNAAPRQSQQEESTTIVHEEPLVPRSMSDSYTELVLPFGSSSELMDQYTNATGGIRMGKWVAFIYLYTVKQQDELSPNRLMEHLDSLAASIAYRHVLGPTVETLGRIQERGFYIVTASVHR